MATSEVVANLQSRLLVRILPASATRSSTLLNATSRKHVFEGAHLLRNMIYLEVSAARERVGVLPGGSGPQGVIVALPRDTAWVA